MGLDEIGFYTLEDERAKRASITSPLWRCELLLTDRCNFRCPYCRGQKRKIRDATFDEASRIVDLWTKEGLKNVRFSGGEPTVWPHLRDIVSRCRVRGIERVAISTNGSAPWCDYYRLICAGVNDFSVSLDACCASVGDMMSGKSGAWIHVVETIRRLSELTYVTVGVVCTDETIDFLDETIMFASGLGVSDIRVISSAQDTKSINLKCESISDEILSKHPILRYRIMNARNGRPVRGITECDNHKCPLVLDDMAIRGGRHYPCIIHLREGGAPIGKVSKTMRLEREAWYKTHNTFVDPICRKNCLDVCVDYNNAVRNFQER